MSYLVGLTGGIGSGKSTVAEFFAALGVRIIDTDVISHQLTGTSGAAIPAIRQAFGDTCIDTSGALDRAGMRQRIFSDPAAKHILESILHPLILAQAKEDASKLSEASYSLVVVPLLFESGRYADWMDRTIAVDCPESVQIARTMQRSKLDEADVRAIMARQLGREERLSLADDIIRNDGDLDNLKAQVAKLHSNLLVLAREKN